MGRTHAEPSFSHVHRERHWSSSLIDDELVIVLGGEIDAGNAEDLTQRLHLECEQIRAERVIIDVRRVTFMDSTGLAMLISTSKALDGTGAELIVRNPSPLVQKLFDITGVGSLFTIQ